MAGLLVQREDQSIAPRFRGRLLFPINDIRGRTDYDPWENSYAYSQLGQPHKRGTEYPVQFPEYLKAFQPYSVASLKGVKDEFGRALQGSVAMDFRTDHRPPRLRVTHPVSVLEKNAPTQMPLYVTNLTDIDIDYRRLTIAGFLEKQKINQPVDRPWDVAYATPAKVRDLLSGESGVWHGTIYLCLQYSV